MALTKTSSIIKTRAQSRTEARTGTTARTGTNVRTKDDTTAPAPVAVATGGRIVRESIRWLALDKELVISDTIETHYWMF